MRVEVHCVEELVRTSRLSPVVRRDKQVDVGDVVLVVLKDVVPRLVVRVATKHDAVVAGFVENHVRATVVVFVSLVGART